MSTKKPAAAKPAAPKGGAKPMTAAEKKAEQAKTAEAIGAMGTALGDEPEPEQADTAMPDNSGTMHTGLHDMHEAMAHFDGEVHADDQWPEDWKPPAELDAPPPRAGMVQRWVRMSLKGKNDGNNLSTQARQGWRPRTLESVPEDSRHSYPTMKDPRTGGSVIINGDLILCEMPKRIADQQSAFYRAKRMNQVSSLVDKPLSDAAVSGSEKHGFGAPRVVERSTRTSVRRPIVASD